VGIVAVARLALARDRLSSRIDAAHVRTDGAAHAPRVAGAVGVDVFEVVQLLGGNSPWGLSVPGDNMSGTPFLQRPHILAARSSG
jgi:hypothetical protein